jgi:DNA modification methylase
MEKIVRENSKPGDTVADFFGGSGTTAIVCEKLGRNFLCCELDEANIEIALKRKSQSFQQPLL